MNSIIVHMLRVFVNKEGKFGNPVGIVLDEKQELSPTNRQSIATKVGFSETVFINDLNTGSVSIYNPTKEVKFAGHALTGTAYFINKILGKPISLLECKGGKIKTRHEGELTWIHASLEGTPPWHHEEFPNADAVEELPISSNKEHTVIWSWLDKNKGIIRARTFAPDWGIPEDEANGSGSMQLAAILGRPLEIRHGKGSIVYAKPTEKGSADVGGRVEQDKSQKVAINNAVSAGGIVVKEIEGKSHILLIIFPDDNGLGFAKGHVNKNESFENAALREVAEETGLEKLRIVKKLGVVTRPSVENDGTKVEKDIHLYLMRADDYNHGDSDENYDWFEVDEAISKMGFLQEAEFLKNIKDEL